MLQWIQTEHADKANLSIVIWRELQPPPPPKKKQIISYKRQKAQEWKMTKLQEKDDQCRKNTSREE